LVNVEQKPGYCSVIWDGRDSRGRTLPSGVYFCQMVTDRYKAQMKVVLNRE
jgi:flagellar hook assembly protein FlgD